jgi:hypothetical protein
MPMERDSIEHRSLVDHTVSLRATVLIVVESNRQFVLLIVSVSDAEIKQQTSSVVEKLFDWHSNCTVAYQMRIMPIRL